MVRRPVRPLERTPRAKLEGIARLFDQASPSARKNLFYKVDSGLSDYSDVHLAGAPLERFEDLAEHMHRELVRGGVLKSGEPLRVLDVGCGKGVLKELKDALARRNVPVEVQGVSLSRIEPDYAEEHALSVHVGNAEALPRVWSNRFHLVVSVGALRYLDGAFRALVEAHRVLHPQGRAFLQMGSDSYHELDWRRMAQEHPEKRILYEPANVEFGKENTRLRLFYVARGGSNRATDA